MLFDITISRRSMVSMCTSMALPRFLRGERILFSIRWHFISTMEEHSKKQRWEVFDSSSIHRSSFIREEDLSVNCRIGILPFENETSFSRRSPSVNRWSTVLIDLRSIRTVDSLPMELYKRRHRPPPRSSRVIRATIVEILEHFKRFKFRPIKVIHVK